MAAVVETAVVADPGLKEPAVEVVREVEDFLLGCFPPKDHYLPIYLHQLLPNVVPQTHILLLVHTDAGVLVVVARICLLEIRNDLGRHRHDRS